MSRKTDRAAAIATAAMFVFALVTGDGSGAIAQDQAAPEAATIAGDAPAAIAAADLAEAVRFVPGEVVQPLPAPADGQDLAITGARSLASLVEALDHAEPLSRDLHCLASAIYFEARGETLAGQLAVGQVVVNRSQSGRFPQDYCGVVAQPGQFSFVSRGSIPAAPQGSAAWQRATAIARIVHQDLWDSAAEDALYFHARRVRPQWASRKLARAEIDNHIFYR